MMSDAEWSEFENRYCRQEKVAKARKVRSYVGPLSAAQVMKCGICGADLEDDPTIDHVIPRSRGGHDGCGNIVAACFPCNNRKGGRMPTGCELIVLIAVNCRMGWEPQRW